MRVMPLLLLLCGCPEPIDDLPASVPAAGVPGQGGEVPPPPGAPPTNGAAPVDGAAQPGPPSDPGMAPGAPAPTGDATTAPPTDAATGPISALGGEIPAGSPPPVGGVPGPTLEELSKRTLASLAEGGATVKIRGRLEGVKAAQVDFTAVNEEDGRKVPELLQIVQVTDGTFVVDAPATYAREIYITATADTKKDGIGPDDPGGIAASPVKLAGTDVDVVIKVTTDGAWSKTVPWYVEGPPPTPPTPGAAGTPAGPPPGAAGTVAPPAGATTPDATAAPATMSSPSGWVFVK